MKLISFFFLVLLLACANFAQASSLDKLGEFVRQTLSATADFEQTVYDKNLKVLQRTQGSMQFLRPGKFRWQYDQPYQQLIVGDGAKLWIYDKDLNQVTVKKLDQAIGASPAAFLAGDSEIENNFTITDMGKRGNSEWLQAVPKGPDSTFEKLLIGFSAHGLEQMELYDRFGHMTRILFTRLKLNPALSTGNFVFSPPDGADVIGE
jgi:outer membrane lipoprotein carrier protein